ncbi:MAG: TraR/DksA family transcriptional regulator [Spirochaetia bacterium]
MEKQFVEDMRVSLFNLKEELLKTMMQESDELKEIVEDMDPKDLVDIASEDIDRTIMQALGAQDMKRLRLIESAISRIENGHYGMCIRCNKKIPKERLEAIPYALMCIACKSSDERRNR